MVEHKSAIKRDRQSKVRYARNKSVRSKVKTAIKKVETAIAEKSYDKAKGALASAIPIIDKAVSKNVIHRNTASRNISRLSKQVHALSTTTRQT